jgi:Flp pilus assembly protein TadB
MQRQSTLRASDADRDAIAERLHQAAIEGRLEADELEDRLHLALRARTYGELGRLVADLPGRRARVSAAPVALAAVVRLVMLVLAVAAVLLVAAFTAAWWVVWGLLWLTVRTRHRRHRGPRVMRARTFP